MRLLPAPGTPQPREQTSATAARCRCPPLALKFAEPQASVLNFDASVGCENFSGGVCFDVHLGVLDVSFIAFLQNLLPGAAARPRQAEQAVCY